MNDYSGPPVRLNMSFLDGTENRFKLGQICLGIASAVFTMYCFPNWIWGVCTWRIHSLPQIFSVVFVNVFFISITTILALCNLMGVPDAYYKYKFRTLEKFIASLATLMYGISSILLIVALLTSEFIASWLLSLIFMLWTLAHYAFDTQRRWKEDSRYFRNPTSSIAKLLV